MANQGQNTKSRAGVSRAITKKWAEAKAINYDDWDDSDGYDPEEPVQTLQDHGRQQSWDTKSQGASSQGGYSNPPGQYYPSNRSVTGPSSTGRASFDRGDDRRHFANMGGAQGAYPTAQRDPFADIQHDQDPNFEPHFRGHRGQPSLQLQTGGRPSMEQRQYQQGPYPQGPYTAGPGGNHFQETRAAPFSAPIIGPPGRRSQSSGRPAPGEVFPRGESPMRPGSQNSRGASPGGAFPPRKSSLSQQQPPPGMQQYSVMDAHPAAQASTPSSESKALPFIRPADIYRRMEEEKEKERRSQESSRPSLDSANNRIRESSVAGQRTATEPAADSRSTEAVDEPDTARRIQPTLPPVAERKSEYGFDNIMQNASQGPPNARLNRTDTDISKASAASSDYTNRPDPTSASTLNSRQSPFDILAESPHESLLPAPPAAPFVLPAVRGVSDFGNDMFGQHTDSSPQLLPHDDLQPARATDRLPSLLSSTQPESIGSFLFRWPHPDAKDVHVTGTFDDWGKSEQLNKVGDIWEKEVNLPNADKKIYYKFVVDDNWVIDPTAPQEDDGHYNVNNVLLPKDIKKHASAAATQPQASTPVTAPREESVAVAPPAGRDLQHQNSQGYRSMVNQAFDQSQDQVPPTPISMSDSVARSNSASASDISPIMGRNYEPPASQPPIPEESNSRPGTSGTQHSANRSIDKELPPPPTIVPGYRRETSPAPSANPEKRPLSIATADMHKSEHAIPSAATSSTASWDKDSEGDAADEDPAEGDETLIAGERAAPSPGITTQSAKPSELSRSASEDWQNWESSRKQFKTQHGVQDSMPSTPGVPSPISRVESPSKGTVRDLANKLESNSGNNSPAILEPPRPINARLDSFRPQLPGGWQSYTTNTGTATPQIETPMTETQPKPASEEAEEDYPKAGPPKDHSAYTKTSSLAFEALAASGSALAGAFGLSQVAREQNRSHESSTDDSRTSTSMSNNEQEAAESPLGQDRQLETIPEGDRGTPASPLPPVPLPKDTPSEADAGRSTLDYFPAPLTLRQSRGPEQLIPPRPTLPASLSTETSPQDDDNDRLRKEIVKSLTPKSSGYDDDSRLSPARNYPVTSGSQRTVSTMGDSNLPKEYDSYWNESNEETSREAALGPSAPYIPPMPETTAVNSNAEADMPAKTTLEQRFSWETAGEQTPPAGNIPARGDSLQAQGSPDTIKAPSAPTSAPISAMTSIRTIAEPISSSEAIHPSPSANIVESKGLPQILETRTSPTSNAQPTPTSNAQFTPTSPSSTFREQPVKDIMALRSPHDRIRAFDSHRQHYATNEDGGLTQWLQIVGRSHPEHAQVMSANGVPTLRDDGTELHRPSPARIGTKFRMPSSSYTGSGETSGTKQIQEDGKRLLHAGGKLGKKGGLAAKGLLAKAKDKARAVSSSDKDVHQNRRRSSQFGGTPTKEEAQHSSTPSAPPQIPSPKLEISPVNHDDWALPFGTPRDDRKPDWESKLQTGTDRGITPNRRSETPTTSKYDDPRNQAAQFSAPAAFTSQVNPSNEGTNRALHESTSSTTEPPKADHQTLRTLEQVVADPTSTPQESRVPLAVAAAVPIAGASTVADDRNLPAENADIVKSNNLAAPNDTNSMISNISSSSPNPANTGDRSRSISPPRRSISNQTGREDTTAPPYTQHFPPTKAAEAEVERAQADAAQGEEPLPTYEQPTVPDRNAPSRLGDNPQIVPVADLSSQRRHESKPVQPRPFSFAGPEGLERMSADASQPAAVGGTLSKQETNVEVTEVTNDSDGAKSPKSFHRPFGVGQEPNVHEHPAFRNPDLTDRSRMYSTENPLPSARRDQSSPAPGQYRPVPQQRIPQEGEEGYKIPGPYVQEYRSPVGKQNVIPFDTRQTQIPANHGPPRSPEGPRDRAIQNVSQPNMAALHGRDMGPPLQRPEQERSKSRTFGGLFKRDKSHSTDQPPKHLKKERRESFFSGRNNSVSSQGSRLGSLRQTPSQEQPFRQNNNGNYYQRRSSKDFSRSSTGFDDESGRKKRFSGIGGFFGKSASNAQRAGVMNTHHPNTPMHQNAFQETRQSQQLPLPQPQIQYVAPSVSGHPLSAPPASEQAYHLRTTNSQENSGYNDPNQRQYPVSAFPHGPDSVVSRFRSLNHERGIAQNASGVYNPTPQPPQTFDQRPQDLRINTGPNPNSTPSYLPPPPMPTNTTMRTPSPNSNYAHNFPTTRAPNSSGTGIPPTNRALDLHKRSRSPKLGRHSSSEDLTQTLQDPAANLGTFSTSKSRSPQGPGDNDVGAQEKPWAISLPADAATAESSKNVLQQQSDSERNRGGNAVVAELPGSKANGYESEEEIVMSATAMPGDQWMPDAMDYAYGRYDD